MALKDLQQLVKKTVVNERIHYSEIRGIEAVYYVPDGVVTTIGNMAYHWGEQQALNLILNIIKDGNTDVKDITEYLESKLNQF